LFVFGSEAKSLGLLDCDINCIKFYTETKNVVCRKRRLERKNINTSGSNVKSSELATVNWETLHLSAARLSVRVPGCQKLQMTALPVWHVATVGIKVLGN